MRRRPRSFTSAILLLLAAACSEDEHTSTSPRSPAVPAPLPATSPGSGEPCVGCVVPPTSIAVAEGTAPKPIVFSADPLGDYQFTARLTDGSFAGLIVTLNGRVIVTAAEQLTNTRTEYRKSLVVRTVNELTVRAVGKPGSTVTIAVLAGAKTFANDGGVLRAPGSGASITVPPGAIARGSLQIQLTDDSTASGLYPTLADHGFRLLTQLSEGAVVNDAAALSMMLPLAHAPQPGQQPILSATINGNLYWVHGVSVAATSSARVAPIPSGSESHAAQSVTVASMSFSIPATALAPLSTLSGGVAGSTALLPQYLTLLSTTCSLDEYPHQWQTTVTSPLSGDPSAKVPSTGDVGIVLVHGWDRSVGDCDAFSKWIAGETYLAKLLRPIETSFGSTNPIWAFTYPTFYQVDKSGGQLAQELEQAASRSNLSGFVIVAHSMGGLVARSAAAKMKANSATAHLLRGVITLGTPHLGAPLAVAGGFLQQSHPFLSLGLNTPGTRDLASGLSSQQEEVPIYAYGGNLDWSRYCFASYFDGLYCAIAAYLALWPSDGIVPTSSAQPDFIDASRRRVLAYDHSELHEGNDRLGDPSDPLYQSIIRDIASLVGTQLPPAATWTAAAPLTGPISRASVVAIGGRLYSFSGYANGPTTGTLVSDAVVGSWTSARSWPCSQGAGSCIAGAGAAEIGGKAFLIGGANSWGWTAQVRVYDPAQDSWGTAASLPKPAAPIAVGMIGGELFVIARVQGLGGQDRWELFAYNPSLDSWRTIGVAPYSQDGASAAIVGDRVYLIGGYADDGSISGAVQVYDTRSQSWSTAPDMPTPRIYSTGVTINGRIVVAGGHGRGILGTDFLSTVEMFDPASGAWTTLPPLLRPRMGIALATMGNNVFAVGGQSAIGGMTLVEYLTVP